MTTTFPYTEGDYSSRRIGTVPIVPNDSNRLGENRSQHPITSVSVHCPTDHESRSVPDGSAGSDNEFFVSEAYPTKECYEGGQDLHDGKLFDGGDFVVPQAKVVKKRDFFIVWMSLLTITFLSLVVYGFASKLFIPNSSANGGSPSASSKDDQQDVYDRQAYYDNLLAFLDLPVLEPASPQAQALEWLAFEDEPLEKELASRDTDPASDNQGGQRVKQRYALVTWYFAQGGPKLWSTINTDSSAGWIKYGAGVHECEWRGIDCEPLTKKDEAVNEKGEIVAIRLSPAVGVVLTGTSLSTEIGMLAHLKRLDVSDQRLQGSIPEEWRSLTNIGAYNCNPVNLLWTSELFLFQWIVFSHHNLSITKSC
jgi:hypothetical protein